MAASDNRVQRKRWERSEVARIEADCAWTRAGRCGSGASLGDLLERSPLVVTVQRRLSGWGGSGLYHEFAVALDMSCRCGQGRATAGLPVRHRQSLFLADKFRRPGPVRLGRGGSAAPPVIDINQIAMWRFSRYSVGGSGVLRMASWAPGSASSQTPFFRAVLLKLTTRIRRGMISKVSSLAATLSTE